MQTIQNRVESDEQFLEEPTVYFLDLRYPTVLFQGKKW